MESIWSDNCKFTNKDILTEDIKVDIAIIGAGMAGMLIAFMLKQNNLNPVIIEANKIASGQTKNTTAKITSQHNLIYDKLIKNFGIEKALQYAKANENAIKKYKEIIEKNNIDCDFEQLPAYVYSLSETQNIEAELKATTSLNINSELTNKTTLPFEIKSAIKFNNQAQFNPLKFIQEISKNITIYENTMAKSVDIDNSTIITNRGNIKADVIIVATHFPFINTPGYYFMRMYQSRSYVIALENAQKLDGMYINENGDYSFRNYKDLLLFGGAGHRTGKHEPEKCYNILRTAYKDFYPQAMERYTWSAQDCITLDGIPYIGHYSTSTPNMYVATGFNKWGMTNSMVSAMIISDLILKNNSEYDIFSPERFNLKASTKTLVEDTVQTISGMILKKFKIPKEDIEHIQRGNGGIVNYEGHKIGVYRNENDEIFSVNTICPHLGCQLEWNIDELSWDCPCHGSRFDYKGNIINNPSIKNLENIDC